MLNYKLQIIYAMTEEKILTQHPRGKQELNIAKDKYEMMKEAIISVMKEKKVLNFEELDIECRKLLEDKFEGKLTWYMVTVKLDLEAKGIIQRVPNTKPQKYRLRRPQIRLSRR